MSDNIEFGIFYLKWGEISKINPEHEANTNRG